MPSTLILYSTTDGHTLDICEALNAELDEKADLIQLDEHTQVDLNAYTTIVIGASIRYGRHRPAVSDFIEKNRWALDTKQTVFFSVSLVARKDNRNTPDTNKYLQKFLSQLNWHPTLTWVLAGKLNYPVYGVLDKLMIRFIMWMTKGPTNPKTVKVFTDWQSVKRLSQKINHLMHHNQSTENTLT